MDDIYFTVWLYSPNSFIKFEVFFLLTQRAENQLNCAYYSSHTYVNRERCSTFDSLYVYRGNNQTPMKVKPHVLHSRMLRYFYFSIMPDQTSYCLKSCVLKKHASRKNWTNWFNCSILADCFRQDLVNLCIFPSHSDWTTNNTTSFLKCDQYPNVLCPPKDGPPQTTGSSFKGLTPQFPRCGMGRLLSCNGWWMLIIVSGELVTCFQWYWLGSKQSIGG
jgi:hypothetical protein